MRHREPTWRSGGHRGGRSGIRGGLRVTAVRSPGSSSRPAAAAGCDGSPVGGGEALKVVTTTTILADLVRQVGGDRVTVASLVPKGGEVHTFDPTPSDVRRVSRGGPGRSSTASASTTGWRTSSRTPARTHRSCGWLRTSRA